MDKSSLWDERAKGANSERQNTADLDIQVESSHIKMYAQQNSPVNNALVRDSLMNDLLPDRIDGQIQIVQTPVRVREKKGRNEDVYTLCSFSYDDAVDLALLNKKDRYKISGYDRRVYDAIGTLYLNGKRKFTLTEIYQVMNGYPDTNPNKNQLQAIERALIKMQSVQVFIDLTAELRAKIIPHKEILVEAGYLKSMTDDVESATIEDRMLKCTIGRFKSKQGRELVTIVIDKEPSLLSYNRSKGTLISIPMEYIGLYGVSSTDKAYAFQNYLLARIFGYKNHRLKENRIRYDTLYRDSGVEKPQRPTEIKRDRELILRMMEEWKSKELLASYTEWKEGKSFVGVMFELAVDGIEDKKET